MPLKQNRVVFIVINDNDSKYNINFKIRAATVSWKTCLQYKQQQQQYVKWLLSIDGQRQFVWDSDKTKPSTHHGSRMNQTSGYLSLQIFFSTPFLLLSF